MKRHALKDMLLDQAFFFNHYAALEATWVAGKLSFEFENLSFELLDSSFEIFNLSFDILNSIFVIPPVNWSQFPLFYEPKMPSVCENMSRTLS